jgi:hypothetical protein
MVTQPIAFGPVARQDIMVEATHLMSLGSKKREGKGQGPNIPFKGIPPSDPTFFH